MTAKINLTSLINYFSDKDKKIASRLSRLAGDKACQACGKIGCDCGCNGDPEKCNCKSEAKEAKFNPAKVRKIAEVLIEIADKFDQSEPELAREADRFLKELLVQANSYCMGPEQAQPMFMAAPMEQFSPAPSMLAESQDLEDDLEHVEEVPESNLEEDLEKDLEEDVNTPATEYDEVSLDDFRNRIDGLNFRLTDRNRKERWQTAHEMAEKAMKHLQRGRDLMDQAHGMLDEGGDVIRFKTGYSWDK